jgi:hypothetical protein
LSAPDYQLLQLASRKDANKDISDLKFNPQNTLLAVGSHEDDVDVYSIGKYNRYDYYY